MKRITLDPPPTLREEPQPIGPRTVRILIVTVTPGKGRPRNTHCLRGHDLTLPGARYRNAACRVCQIERRAKAKLR